MTVSNRPQTRAKLLQSSCGNTTAQVVPLIEERFAILGHEIRNPLSALSSALQAWPSFGNDPQLTDALLQIMRRQVVQLTRLCNDLLDTGGMAQGRLPIHRATVDIGQVIRSACEEIRPLMDQCGHTMTSALGNSPIMLVGDESRLTQVFANLMHNAAKFNDRNGQLHISLERDDDTVVVRLRDNGHGICEDKLRSMFLDDNTSNKCREVPGAGLGIGLRLAKSIVELHGGTIQAFSEGSGRGSTFVVKLPLVTAIPADKPLKPSQPIPPDRKNEVRLPRYRIVVVDDDRSLRFLMSRLLQRLGQSVTDADSGDRALQIILQSRPDVVFLDLQMHGKSGYEVARQIRSRIDLNDVIIIALSGNSDAASRKLAAESGFDHYLVKPTSISELEEMLIRVGSSSACTGTLLPLDTSDSLTQGMSSLLQICR